ncbi:MAG: hypothetical protein AAF704_14625 [Cyanobacteria bacterium P01_D01_bin.123]
MENVIFSRKGFDSGYGGVPSPILPGGRLLSLPIPYRDRLRTYQSVAFDNRPLAKIVISLTKGNIPATATCHLDPDLRVNAVPRSPGWRPIFGQVGAAQKHLQNRDVGVGDLFLFFGWFRETRLRAGKLVFVPKAPNLHVLFGWLQIGAMHHPRPEILKRFPWAIEHPHCIEQGWDINNTIYLAAPQLQIPGVPKRALPGAGVFPCFHPELQLTQAGRSRSIWQLPAWMHPQGRDSTLSYHHAHDIWRRAGDRVILKSRSRGQEFVLNVEHYPEAKSWLATLFQSIFYAA